MTAKRLFSKTLPFVWAKLLLGGAAVLISAILLALLMGLGWLFGEIGMVIMFIIWCGAIRLIWGLLMNYAGYLLKAGHIAVIAEACFTGQVPDNQVAYGKAKVTERFITSNVYFAVDKLVTKAVQQIQSGLGKLTNKLDAIPGMEAITGVAQFFISISLGYIDECCLGWTFYKKEQGAFQSAADGVVIYAQNWKTLLKDAAITMLRVILLTIGIALITFIPIAILFKILKWSGLAAFVLALLIAWVIKFAVMDSYIMIQMMASYMQVAPATTITFDLYAGLSKLSSSFQELFQKGQSEAAASGSTAYQGTSTGTTTAYQTAAAATAAGAASATATAAGAASATADKSVFCGQCGAKHEPGTKFCGACGSKL